jgi:hypothetical protein
MTKNEKKLVWRLSTKPTVDEVVKLVEKKILKEEEAKEILFSSQPVDEKETIESLKAEIKFLKDLIMHMKGQETIRETIRYIEKPYYNQWPWYTGTVTYLCSAGDNSSITNGKSDGFTLTN